MATLLSDLVRSSLRRAGITQLPGIVPSPDQFNELIPEFNRWMSSNNLDGHRVYQTSIDRYAMVPGQTSYFLGPTGDWNAPRPNFISRANVVILNASPEYRKHVKLLSDAEWGRKGITELPGAWPYELYDDGSVPDTKLYLYPYPTQVNDLELYTAQQILPACAAITDTILLPDGYEQAIVTGFALQVESLYPHDAKVADETRRQAVIAMQRVIVANARNVPHRSEAANLGGRSGAGTTAAIRSGNWMP